MNRITAYFERADRRFTWIQPHTFRWFFRDASWTGRKYWLFETFDAMFDWIEQRWPRIRPLTSKIWAPGPHVPHGDYDHMPKE